MCNGDPSYGAGEASRAHLKGSLASPPSITRKGTSFIHSPSASIARASHRELLTASVCDTVSPILAPMAGVRWERPLYPGLSGLDVQRLQRQCNGVCEGRGQLAKNKDAICLSNFLWTQAARFPFRRGQKVQQGTGRGATQPNPETGVEDIGGRGKRVVGLYGRPGLIRSSDQ